MKRYALILAAILLCAQTASASDTTGALVLIPIAGGLAGLAVGAVVCFVVNATNRGKRAIWLSLPLFGVAGVVLSLVAAHHEAAKYEDKVVCSFGNYDRHRGGLGVIQVPHDFSAPDLEQFYSLLTNRDNAILSSHEFAAALVHQGNGLDQVYLNVSPDLQIPDEYTKVNDEVQRQMDTVLKHRTP